MAFYLSYIYMFKFQTISRILSHEICVTWSRHTLIFLHRSAIITNFYFANCDSVCISGGTQRRCWFNNCATIRKVAVSIPDGLTGIFHWHNPSGHTMALGWTQHLQSKGGRCVRLTTLPLSYAVFLEIWEPKPPGTLSAYLGLLYFFV